MLHYLQYFFIYLKEYIMWKILHTPMERHLLFKLKYEKNVQCRNAVVQRQLRESHAVKFLSGFL